MSLRQGRRSILDYAIEFRTLATESRWNNAALVNAFVNGLFQRIKDQLIFHDLLDELDSIVAISNKIGNRLQDYDKERVDALSTRAPLTRSPARENCPLGPTAPALSPVKVEVSPPEPMQLGWSWLSAGERE